MAVVADRQRHAPSVAGGALRSLALALVALLLTSACSFVTFSADETATGAGDANDGDGDTGTADGDGDSTDGGTADADPDASSTTTIDPSDAAAVLCGRLPGLPFAARRSALDDAAPQVAEDVAATCPEELAAIEEVEAVADRSTVLDREDWLDEAIDGFDCSDTELTADVLNVFDDPVRLIAVANLLSGPASDVVGAGWLVSEPVEPGTVASLTIEYDGGPPPAGALNCNLSVQAFLALDATGAGDEVTDLWDADLGEAASLPDTTGEDWDRLVPLILQMESEVNSSGDWPRAAGFEDVRSKNYRALVNRRSPQTPTNSMVEEICTVDELGEHLTAVAWVQESGGARGVFLGVFQRSLIDDRWRWVHTGMFLAGGENGCAAVTEPTT